MFNNPLHQEIDESDEIKPAKVLFDTESSATEQSMDASCSNDEKFDNKFFNLNKSGATDSVLSNSNIAEQLQTSMNKDLINQVKKQSGKKAEKNKGNMREKLDSKEIVQTIMSKLERRAQRQGSFEEQSSKTDSLEHGGSRDFAPNLIHKCASDSSDKLRGNLLDHTENDEIESSMSLTRDEIIKNPFPLLNASQQKESEEEFKTELRETADFQPQLEKKFGIQGPEKKEENKGVNPFAITTSNEQENYMRPSGDFGLKGPSQNQSSQKLRFASDLGEICETQAEYRDSALETQNEEVEFPLSKNNPGFNSDARNQGNRSVHGISNLKMIGIEDVFEADTEDSRDFSQIGAPVFANLYYDKDSNVSQNKSNLKDDSTVSYKSAQTPISQADKKTQNQKNDSQTGSINPQISSSPNIGGATQQPIGMFSKPQPQQLILENHRVKSTDEEPGDNVLEELNECHKNIVQDSPEGKNPNGQEVKNTQGDRVSQNSQGIDRKSNFIEAGENQNYFSQGDLDFFNKVLDISGIQQLTENDLNDLDFEQSFIGTDAVKRTDMRRLTPKVSSGENKLKIDVQPEGLKEKGSATTGPSKLSQRQEPRIVKVEGVHYVPSSKAENQQQKVEEATRETESEKRMANEEKLQDTDKDKLRSEIRQKMSEIEKDLASRREQLSNMTIRTVQNNPFNHPGGNTSDEAKKFVDDFFKNSVKGKVFQTEDSSSAKTQNQTKTDHYTGEKNSNGNSMPKKTETNTKANNVDLTAGATFKENLKSSNKQPANQQGKNSNSADFKNANFCDIDPDQEGELIQIEVLDIKGASLRALEGRTQPRLIFQSQEGVTQRDNHQSSSPVDKTPNSLNSSQYSQVGKSANLSNNSPPRGSFGGGNESMERHSHNTQIFSPSNMTNRIILPERVVYDLKQLSHQQGTAEEPYLKTDNSQGSPVKSFFNQSASPSKRKTEDASSAEHFSIKMSQTFGSSPTKKPLYSIKSPPKTGPRQATDDTNEFDQSIQENVQPRRVPAPHTKPNKKKTIVKLAPHTEQRTVFGYRVKSDTVYRDPGLKKINMNVFCINCDEFIDIDQVDGHSLSCVKKHGLLSQEKFAEDYFDTTLNSHSTQALIEETNEKIEIVIVKLCESLRLASQNELGAEFKDSCRKLIKVARDIVSEDKDFKFVKQKMQEFDKIFGPLSAHAKGPETGILVYAQRMFVALQKKAGAFESAFHRESNRILELQEQLNIYERETLKRKAELEFWQYQSEMLKDIQKLDAKNMKFLRNDLKRDMEVLSQICSEIDSSVDQSEDSVGTTESESPLSSVLTQVTQLDREALRRYFYTEAVNLKTKLPLNHPGQDYLISNLYDQCMMQNIPKEEYINFIKRNYNLI